MTAEEAIKGLKVLAKDFSGYKPNEKMFEMAIEALEKQIQMKPKITILEYKCKGEIIKIKHPECPRCRENGLILWDAEIPINDKYCKRCGQKIDWSEGEG